MQKDLEFPSNCRCGCATQVQRACNPSTPCQGVCNLFWFTGFCRHWQWAAWDKSKASGCQGLSPNISLYGYPSLRPISRISTCFSPSSYLFQTQVLFSNCEHKLPCAEDSETERKNFSPLHMCETVKWIQTGATCQGTEAWSIFKASICLSLHLYCICSLPHWSLQQTAVINIHPFC